MMDGVRKMDVARTARDQVPHVMQHALCATMPIGAMLASRTRLPTEIAAPFDDLRLGQVLSVRDAFGGVGQILSRSWHGIALLGNAWKARKLPEMCRRVIIKTQ